MDQGNPPPIALKGNGRKWFWRGKPGGFYDASARAVRISNSRMLAYELYTFNEKEGYEFIGVLPERRLNSIRITKDSVMNWGKTLLGDHVKSENMFFKRVAIDSLSGRILWIDPSFKNN